MGNGDSGAASGAGRLRIAHLTATFPPYLAGTGTACLHMAAGMAARGHHVEVFTARPSGWGAAEGNAGVDAADREAGGAAVHRLEPLLAIGNAPLIPRLASLTGFDIVHLHHPFIFGTELTLLARLRSRAGALVVSYHNRLAGDGARRPLFWAYEETVGRLMARSADRVCVLSRQHAESVEYLRATARRSPDRIAVVTNGVDTDAFAPFAPGPAAGIRAGLDLPEDAPVAVFVAALDRAHWFKRLDLAIEALARARDPRLCLVVVGGGELTGDHRELAARLGVAERVRFAGPAGHDRLPDLLRACDLILVTSDPPESFGIVLLEAMACGLPAVATDYPGAAAVVEDGRTGVLVSRGDADSIAAGIDRLLAIGPEGRREMGLAGRAECERRYAWPRVVDTLDAVYRAALSERIAR